MGRNVGKWGISQFVSQLNAYIPILANECMGGPSDRGRTYIFLECALPVYALNG